MIKNITITEADLNEYQIFDVRSPREWENGVLPNAQCLALYDNHGFLNENFIKEFKEKLKKDKKVAFVCHSGHRSKIAAEMVAQELGIYGVNLEGGMALWMG